MVIPKFEPMPLDEILSPEPLRLRKPPPPPDPLPPQGQGGALSALLRRHQGAGVMVASRAETVPGRLVELANGSGSHPMTAVPQTAVRNSDFFMPAGKLALPTEFPLVTSEFGNRELGGRMDFHKGVDIRALRNTPIHAADDGTVMSVYSNPTGGNQIRILHPDGFVSGYAHVGATVRPGQKVRRGEVIGHSDGSGGVTPHLHFTYRPGMGAARVDPYPFLPQVPIKK